MKTFFRITFAALSFSYGIASAQAQTLTHAGPPTAHSFRNGSTVAGNAKATREQQTGGGFAGNG
jgi:hypothetical protein